MSGHTPCQATDKLIWQEYIPGGSGGTAPGAVGTIGEQVVLCTSGVHMFELTNISGVAVPLNLSVSYYQVAA